MDYTQLAVAIGLNVLSWVPLFLALAMPTGFGMRKAALLITDTALTLASYVVFVGAWDNLWLGLLVLAVWMMAMHKVGQELKKNDFNPYEVSWMDRFDDETA
jgi:hypothetical protein